MMTKTPRESVVQTRKIVSQEHLNPNGVLFGGYLMCWMDEIAFMSARRFAGTTSCVTVNIDNISFLEPIKLGEEVLLTACVNFAGRSSMEIGVKVEREDSKTGEMRHTNSAYLTFVCLDKYFKPAAIPKIVLETDEDERRYQEAHLRIKIRKRLKNHLRTKLKISNQTKTKRHGSVQKKSSKNFLLKAQRETKKAMERVDNSKLVKKIKKISNRFSIF